MVIVVQSRVLSQCSAVDHKSCRSVVPSSYRALSEMVQVGVRQVSRPWVARIMKSRGWQGKCKRKFRVKTDSKHSLGYFDNKLDRAIGTEKPNMIWASHITYILTSQDWALPRFFLLELMPWLFFLVFWSTGIFKVAHFRTNRSRGWRERKSSRWIFFAISKSPISRWHRAMFSSISRWCWSLSPRSSARSFCRSSNLERALSQFLSSINCSIFASACR